MHLYLLIVFSSSFALFGGVSSTKWPLTATGRVTCNDEPLVDLLVKLMDEDFSSHDIMGRGKTNENGDFTITGSGADAFGGKPEPYILIEYNYQGKYGSFKVENHWGLTREEKSKTVNYPQNGTTINFQNIRLGAVSSHCSNYLKFYKTLENAYNNKKNEPIKETLHIRTEVKDIEDYSLAQCSSQNLIMFQPGYVSPEMIQKKIDAASVTKDCKVVLGSTNAVTCRSRYLPHYTGTCMDANECKGGTLSRLCKDKRRDIKCCIPEVSSIPEPTNPLMTKETFFKLLPNTTRNRALFKYFAKTLNDGNIKTCHAQAALFSQMSFETTSFKFFEEESDGKKYENKTVLGNTEKGDGKKYIGRGMIHLTGRYNYGKTQTGTGYQIVNKPEMVACIPRVAFDTAIWKWTNGTRIVQGNKVVSKSINELCDGTIYSYYLLTYAVNGGLNGLTGRLKLWENAIKTLGCSAKTALGHGPPCTDVRTKETGFCNIATRCKGRTVKDDASCYSVNFIKCCIG